MVIIAYYESECLSNSSIEEQNAYAVCKAGHHAFKWSVSPMWILGVGCLVLILILAILLFYLWRRKYCRMRSSPSEPSAEKVRKVKMLKGSTSRSNTSRCSFRSTTKGSTNTSGRSYDGSSPTSKSCSKTLTSKSTDSSNPPCPNTNRFKTILKEVP